MLKIAILGLGEGRSTMSAALHSSKLELVMVCDRNEDLCKQRAKEFDFHAYTTNYEELLLNNQIDIELRVELTPINAFKHSLFAEV